MVQGRAGGRREIGVRRLELGAESAALGRALTVELPEGLAAGDEAAGGRPSTERPQSHAQRSWPTRWRWARCGRVGQGVGVMNQSMSAGDVVQQVLQHVDLAEDNGP